MDFLKKNSLKILFLAGLINLAIYSYLFGFHPNNDTEQFLIANDFFSGKGDIIYPNRYLNPFYSIVASTFLPFLSAANALILINIFFYFGLLYITYDLVHRVLKSKFAAFSSALIVVSSYPMVRYALTQVQDIGGYFWFIATVYFSWRWYEENASNWVILGGISTAFGVLTKESGCMGAIFFGLLLLQSKMRILEKAKIFLLFSIFPMITIVVNWFRSKDMDYNSLQWFVDNWHAWAPGNYVFIKWLGVNATSFNIIWPLIFVSLGLIFFKKIELSSDQKKYFFFIIPSSASYFAWPVFMARTVFVSIWFLVPLAVLSLLYLYKKNKPLAILALSIVVVLPSVLQDTIRYAHLFKIYDDCGKNISCSWDYFWQHRTEFSTDK